MEYSAEHLARSVGNSVQVGTAAVIFGNSKGSHSYDVGMAIGTSKDNWLSQLVSHAFDNGLDFTVEGLKTAKAQIQAGSALAEAAMHSFQFTNAAHDMKAAVAVVASGLDVNKGRGHA